MMGCKKYFLFDMDGTILDSAWFWDRFITAWLAKKGFRADEQDAACFRDMTLRESAEKISQKYSLCNEGITVFEEWSEKIMKAYSKQLHLKRGAAAYMRKVKERNGRIALVTANHRDLAEAVLKRWDILKFFDVLVCGDEMETDKSDPEYYRKAVRMLEGKMDDTVLFEDSIAAVETAARIPLDVILIKDSAAGTGERHDLEELKVLFRIDDFTDERIGSLM